MTEMSMSDAIDRIDRPAPYAARLSRLQAPFHLPPPPARGQAAIAPELHVTQAFDAKGAHAFAELAADELGGLALLATATSILLGRIVRRPTIVLAIRLSRQVYDGVVIPLVVDLPPEQTLHTLIERVADDLADAMADPIGTTAALHATGLVGPVSDVTLTHAAWADDGAPMPGQGITICLAANHAGIDVKGSGTFETNFITEIAEALAGWMSQFEHLDRPLVDFGWLCRPAVATTPESTPPEGRATLVEMFLAAAKASGETTALVSDDCSMTYAELERRSAALARQLRTDHGSTRESLVGVLFDRSPEMVVAVLGTIRAGAAFVPLDPSYPVERIRQIALDASLSLVLCGEGLEAKLPDGIRTVRIDAQKRTDAAADDILPEVRPQDLAYVLYTSGSTGKPKGCALEHRNIANYIAWACDYYFPNSDDGNFGLYSSLCFDFTLTNLFCPLARGKTLRLYPQHQSIDTILRRAFTPDSGIDTMKLTPAHISLIDDLALSPGTGVQRAIVGGEDLLPRHVKILRELNPEIEIFNEYGPTEAAVGCIVKRIGDSDAPILIGRPIRETQVFVTDEFGHACPPMVTGEICVAGDSVARGYYGRDDLTAARFVTLPGSGLRVYRTGDLGRYWRNGELQCFGRADDQVKIRGFRVELGEIESVLSEHPAVSMAAVIVRPATDGLPTLKGYVRLGSAIDVSELRTHLSRRLPPYMVPATITALDRVPLNPNGKLDRRALAAMVDNNTAAETVETVSFTPGEAAALRLLSDLLPTVMARPDDDLIDLGMDSLRVMRLLGRLWRDHAIEMTLDETFALRTPRNLAREIAKHTGQGPAVRANTTLARIPREQRHELSLAQQRLWLLDRIDGAGGAYHVVSAIEIDGVLDDARLAAALTALVARHEILRTVYPDDAGVPYAHVLPDTPATFEVTTLADDACLAEAISAETMRPLDLAIGPLFRASLFRAPSGRQVLCLVLHHLLCDAWSGEIVASELATLYQGQDLPAQRVQYLDFAAWQRRHVKTGVVDNAIKHAVARLQGAPFALALPLDAPRPETPGFDGGVERRILPATQVTALREMGRTAGATLPNVLLAAWAALLCRVSGQTDLVIGMPVAHRPHPDLETVIGLFVNSVALRFDLSGDPGRTELVDRARLATREALAEAEVPFESVVSGLDLPRDTSISPVFQVMFAHEAPVLGEPDAHDPERIVWRPLALAGTHAKFDLTLHASETPAAVEISLEYRTDLFTQQTARRLLDWYGVILDAFVAPTDIPMTRINLLDDAERIRVLALGKGPVVDYGPVPLHELIARQAALTPNAPAIMVEEGEGLTYSALMTAADALASRLAARGVRPGVPVGVSIPRSPDLVVALLGVLRAGGAYVPIDPDLPASRIAHIIEQAGITIAVVDHDPVAALRNSNDITLLESRDSTDILASPPIAAGLDDLAYIIFTSGSTGRPKGARNLHRGIANRLLWMQATYPIGARDVVLQKTRASFDVSIWEFFWPLMTGAQLVLAPPSAGGDAAYIAAMIARHAVSIVHFVPAMLRAFLAQSGTENLSSLRHVFCSGEALTTDLVHLLRARVACPLHNLYGPTEAAVDVTHHTCTADETARIVSIGRPIANLRCHIVDAHGLLCPPGVPGELLLGGIGVGDGYQRAPELTAERFLSDRWSDDPTARLYRTGDLARMTLEGDIEFLGRLDHQVKLRGQRIELGEIEAVLREHPSVHDAIASLRQGSISTQLIAHVATAQSGVAVTGDALRQHVAARLPGYMIPTWFVVMNDFPLLPNGKVNRRALPEPSEEQPAPGTNAPPLTPELAQREARLTEIWRDVLRLEAISRHDNFFAKGGDSILAMQVVARAARMGIALTARQIFQAQTIADLARLAPAQATQPDMPRMGDAPALPMQRWLMAQALPDFKRVQQSILLSVPASMDEKRLAHAVAGLLQHHEALGLRLTGETMHLDAISSPDFAVEMLAGDFGTALPSAIYRDAEGIDPLCGPVFRARLYRSPQEPTARLWLAAHHAAIDAVSWRVLLDDLNTLYAGGTLPPASASLRAWAFALRDAARSEAGQEAGRAWLRRLSDAPPPYGSARAAALHTHGHATTIIGRIDAVTTQTLLMQTAPGLGVRFEDLLLGALAVAWEEVMGQETLLVDVEGHGRDIADLPFDLSRTIGWFTAIVPCLLRRTSNDGAADIARAIHADREPGFLDPTALRFGTDDPSLARALEQLPRAAVLFNYHGRIDRSDEGDVPFASFAGEDIELSRHPDARCSHPIEIVGSISAAGLETSWTYGGKLQTPALMEELISAFEAELRAVADAPLVPVKARYALSPLQEGMLFHHLYETGRDDNFQQFSVEITGPLDTARLRAAWQNVVRRHAALRTAFDWGDGQDPTQVVEAEVTLPWAEHDLSGEDGLDAARARSADLLMQDRALGIDLRRAPVLRCALHHLGVGHALMAWSTHHILLDGWSVAILVDQVLQAYHAPEPWPIPAPSFSLYLDWLAARDATRDAEWWHNELAEWQVPTRLPNVPARPSGGEPVVLASQIDAAVLAGLEHRARQAHVTMNALIRAAYAILLGRICGTHDVVFGAVISGRPPELPGVETMLGMFINTIAVRARLLPDEDFDAFAARLALRQAEAEAHGAIPLVEVRRMTPLPTTARLFDALLVFENFPTTEMEPDGSDLRFGALHMPQTDSGTPLCLTVMPGTSYHLHFAYDAARIDVIDATRWRDGLIEILTVLAQGVSCRTGAFLSDTATPADVAGAVGLDAKAKDEPASVTERTLLDLWKTVLGQAEIGLDDDYFELGGHSILAVRMMSRIEKAFGRRMPISVLFENPTVRRLARLLATDDDTDRKALVTLRGEGSGTPLFLFPGAGGHALYFQPLVRALETATPVYGLEAVTYADDAEHMTSVEAIAAHHVGLIRAARGNGPYCLGGHSFGASVAIEVARQLLAQGARVDNVIVIDSIAPLGATGASYWEAWDDIDWLLAIAHEIGVFLDVDLGVNREGLEALSVDARLPDVAARIEAAGDAFRGVSPERLLDYLRTYRAQFAMTYVATFPPLDVPITLLRSTDAEPGDHEPSADVAALRTDDESWGWSRLTSRPVAVHDVPGTHLSCLMSSHVAAIARIINSAKAPLRQPMP